MSDETRLPPKVQTLKAEDVWVPGVTAGYLQAQDAELARLRGEVERLTRERDREKAALDVLMSHCEQDHAVMLELIGWDTSRLDKPSEQSIVRSLVQRAERAEAQLAAANRHAEYCRKEALDALQQATHAKNALAQAQAQLAAAREDTERSGLYVASKVKHAQMWLELRSAGVQITSTWIDEAGEGQTVSYSELAPRCLAEIRRSAAFLLYCEPEELLKGAILEAGAALAFGLPVYCVGTCGSLSRVFVEHPNWHTCESLRAAIDAARKEQGEK